MMSDMMRGMHVGEMSFFWPTTFIISTTAVVVIVVYAILFPSIKFSPALEKVENKAAAATALNPMDIVIRISKPDERVILEVLKETGGVCYQKDITYKTGFSKIKTHRIVARLAERGLIQVKKSGKTNEISIPNWLKMQGR